MIFSCVVDEDSWVFWTARRSIYSILKAISPEYSLGGVMLKLKLQYFGHLTRRPDLLEKILMLAGLKARGDRDDRGWDDWMASLTQWTWVWANSGRRWRTGKPHVLQSMGSKRAGHDWVTELNWWIQLCKKAFVIKKLLAETALKY